MNCPNCGRFVGNVRASRYGMNEDLKVRADCKKCGTVDVTNSGDWWYEDFFPEGL